MTSARSAYTAENDFSFIDPPTKMHCDADVTNVSDATSWIVSHMRGDQFATLS